MPTNLYGPNDNFDFHTSHVLPAMIRKFHEAKLKGHEPVILWGSGSPIREFLHVDELAQAVCFAVENQFPERIYNVCTGQDLGIKSLAELVQSIVGHRGTITWDSSKPDGTPRKLLDVSKMASQGWHSAIDLEEGTSQTYQWFLTNINQIKEVKL
jgi:GDP-L-fucose synthase